MIFGLTEEQTDATEDTSPAGQEPKLKVESGIKTEDNQPPIHPDALTGSLFKKAENACRRRKETSTDMNSSLLVST